MKKILALFFGLLIAASLCLVGNAATPKYELRDALTVLDDLVRTSVDPLHPGRYDMDKNGKLQLADALMLLRYLEENCEDSDCRFTHRQDHACVGEKLTNGEYTDLSYYSAACRITMEYRVYLPRKYSPENEYALVVFLHGLGSERQPISSLTGGALFNKIQGGKREKETILLIPKCPVGMTWPDDRAKTVETAYEIIDMLASHLAIDRDRMYLSGHSNGAKGVAYMIDSHPNTFAAGILSAGASSIGNYKNLAEMANTPMRLFCSSDDPYKFAGLMKKLTLALTLKGGDAVYKEYSGLGHGIFSTVSNEPGLIDWMYEQTLAKE